MNLSNCKANLDNIKAKLDNNKSLNTNINPNYFHLHNKNIYQKVASTISNKIVLKNK